MVDILGVKQLTEQSLLSIPGVLGVGIGASSAKKINVYVEKATMEILSKVPSTIGGFPVKIIQTGKIRALSLLSSQLEAYAEAIRTQKARPAMGGMSIGITTITAGTLGGVFDGLILSNNHVLAASSTIQNPKAQIGAAIIQPGSYDSGTLQNDQIATLESYVPMDESKPNLVDAAWAKPLKPEYVSEEILGIGKIMGFATPEVEMAVQKSGRTTGLTTGKIIDVNATVTVDYDGKQIQFIDQVVTSGMMSPGDSGSLGLTLDNKVWGLGFAGSDDVSVFNKISNLGLGTNATSPVTSYQINPAITFGVAFVALGYAIYKIF